MSLLKMGLDNYPTETNSNDYTCITSHGRVFNFNENELRYDLIGQLTYDNTPIYELYNCVKFSNYILCFFRAVSGGSTVNWMFNLNEHNAEKSMPIQNGYATTDNNYLYAIRSGYRYFDKWYLDPLDNSIKLHSSSNYSSYALDGSLISVDNSFIITKNSARILFFDKEILTEGYSKTITGLGSNWINYGDYIIYSVASGTTNQIGKFVKPGTDNPNLVGTSTVLVSSSGSTTANKRYPQHIWKDILLYTDGNNKVGTYDLLNSQNIQSPVLLSSQTAWFIQRIYSFDNFIINGSKPDTAINVNPFEVYSNITTTTPFNSNERIYYMWKN